ncbi:MAG TPA: hypothetical protein VGY54_18410 [Polyangiaceae bacterium]|jgi:hypothetical protein|nr:hypothetical protein [Polyangiaceae bacterium]
MVSIELTREDLIVRIHGWDKLRAMRSALTVPLGHVTGVRAQPQEAHFDDVIIESWRGIGTYVPGKIAAGTCYVDGGRIFFDVQDPQKTIAIDVKDEAVQHIVVELADEAPDQAVQRIEKALGAERVSPKA